MVLLAAFVVAAATLTASASDAPPATPACTFAQHDFTAATTLGSVSATTPAECCADCKRRAGCQVGILDAAGQCYLKSGLISSTGCKNCTSCVPSTQPPDAGMKFGPVGFKMELSATTLNLRNLSVSSTDDGFTQGFIMNDAPPPLQTEWPLWKLNVTDCKSALPFGTAVTPCLGAVCGNTSHTLSDDGRTLTLRWERVPLPPPFTAHLDVTVNVTQLPSAQPGVSLRGAVALSRPSNGEEAGSVCLQTFGKPSQSTSECSVQVDTLVCTSSAADAQRHPNAVQRDRSDVLP
jgi:hypothetical protein